jgi:hypothetical protein
MSAKVIPMRTKAAKAKAPAKVDRRPYAHAADTREALLSLHSVLAELNRLNDIGRFRTSGPVTQVSPTALLIWSWEMTEMAEKLRGAAKRVLVASYGLKDARRSDGWRRGQWIGSPTYRTPLERAAEKRRKAAK